MHPLIRKWFHNRTANRQIHNQGQILSVGDGLVEVQLYSFMDGSPTCRKVFPLTEALTWDLYATDRDMRRQYMKETGRDDWGEWFEKTEAQGMKGGRR